MKQPQIIFIVGPTAVGKTDVAFEFAGRARSEIVSCDSMQVYREVSIASSKPSLAQRKKVPHHLVDVVSVEDGFDVAAFNTMAREAIDMIFKKGKCPLVVGGSGMYMQVLLDGIFEKGGPNAVVRRGLEEREKHEGLAVLYKELAAVDPKAAVKIHSNDARRIIRALEVYQTTQTPISELQKDRSGLWGHFPVALFVLDRPREELYERINQRVEKMFTDGLVEEIKALSSRNLSLTAQRIIGVREVQAYLRGECDLEQAKELMKMNTRRFAKRQMTWFRKDQRLRWLMMDQDDSAPDIVEKILKEMEKT